MNLLPKNLLFKNRLNSVRFLLFECIFLLYICVNAQQEFIDIDVNSQISDTILTSTPLNNIIVTMRTYIIFNRYIFR